jgi:hemin uptake protein HemP
MTLTANSHKHRLSLGSAGRERRALAGQPVSKSDYDTRELFSGQRQIHIRHNDETYRLSITKQGKLILTK